MAKRGKLLAAGAKKSHWIVFLMVAIALSAGLFGAWSFRAIVGAVHTENVVIDLRQGTSMREVSRQAQAASGMSAIGFEALARVTGKAGRIKPGRYRIDAGMTPVQLLDRLVKGEGILVQVTILEGWTFAQMREVIDAQPDLKHDTKGMSGIELLKRLGAPDATAEGLFFPDTYKFSPGTSDLVIYRQSLEAMSKLLELAWRERFSELPLNKPYEALILASIVEKETGLVADRPQVASVFINRLRKGMLLQTDPTVIYGLGNKFDGDLRKADLMSDSPYNTYLRSGLPPTPICLPGRDSVLAVTRPAISDALYFVARGDGSSQFSASLDEHNRAVSRYQRVH
jgi:UPF0755 protein